MKVLHIIPGNDSGGAKTHLLNLCKNSGRLFQNVIGCINHGVLSEEAVSSNINTIVFRQNSRMDLGVVGEISSYIKDNQIDILNFHGAKSNFIHYFLRHRVDVPSVTTVHSDYRYDFINNFIKHMIFTPLNSLSLRKFKHFICVSSQIAGLLDEKGFTGNKYVVNNGIDMNIEIKASREAIRNQYSIEDDAFVYVMVARMHPVKNHNGLLKAARELVREYKDVRLLLVGSGDYENTVRSKAKELGIERHVVFAGMQDNPLDYINAGDINVLTSFNETFPLVILEGAAVKKAALSSCVGDVKNIIFKDTGFLVDPESVEDIYSKMKEAYIRRTELSRLGEDLYNVVLNEYSIERFCERYFNAYKSILEGGNHGKTTGI